MFRAVKLELSRKISAATERVWSLITDLDAAPARISGIDAIERLSGPEFGVGTRWRETRTMFGREATEEMEVATVSEGSAYTVVAESHGMKYHSEWRVDGRGDRTSLLTMTFSGEPQGFGAKLMAATVGLLFRRATKKALMQDLDDVAAAAEAPAGK